MKKIIGIIGGGPAGMSCALWLKNLGFQPIIFEQKDQLGGLQTINPFHNRWYLGVTGQTGIHLAEQFQQQMELERIPTIFNAPVEKIVVLHGAEASAPLFHLFTADYNVEVEGIVIATGQRFRGPETITSIAGSDRLSASRRVGFNPGTIPQTPGQVVAIVGGGDNGLGIAAILADTAKHIHLFIRSTMGGFTINQSIVMDYVKAGRISLHQPASLHQFDVQDRAIAIYFQVADHGQKVVSVDYLGFRLGFSPNVEAIATLLADAGLSLKLTPTGHIYTDECLRTSIPRVYAIGDVTKPRDPCVATAVAYGAIAARSIDQDIGCH